MVIILSLITSVLEAARVNAAFSLGRQVAAFAADSLLTEYYHPLYKEYHLFFLRKGINTDSMESGDLENTVLEYLQYTCTDKKDNSILSGTGFHNLNLYQIRFENIRIMEAANAIAYDGKIFAAQAMEYMKYRIPALLADELINTKKVLKSVETLTAAAEEKIMAEDKLYSLGNEIAGLMKFVDGITINNGGVQYTTEGLIRSELYYVKKFCPVSVTPESVGINNQLVWDSLKNKYINPLFIITEADEAVNESLSLIRQVYRIQNDLSDLTAEGYGKEEKKKINKKRKKLEKQIIEIQKDIQSKILLAEDRVSDLITLSKDIKDIIQKTLSRILDLEVKQQEASTKLNSYKNFLLSNKEHIDQAVYRGLKEELDDMEQYLDKESKDNKEISMISRALDMLPLLEDNYKILEAVLMLEQFDIQEDEKGLEKISDYLTVLSDKVRQYHVKELSFDYSSIQNKQKIKNPLETVDKVSKSRLLNLIIDETTEVSQKEMAKPDYLYKLYNTEYKNKISKETENNLMDNKWDKNGLEETFHNAGKSLQISGESYLSDIERNILLNEYAIDHFTNFLSPYPKDGALNYELEYVMTGKGSDQENLKAVLNQIILMRTILNYFTLLSDRSKGYEAYGMAASLVGFTGMEPLIRLTKNLILMAWGYEEALVDAAALLAGNKVPLIKRGDQILIQFRELVLFNKQLIQQKVKQIECKKEFNIALTYIQYLRTLLALEKENKKNFRMLDLMESNMRLKYDADFSVEKCINSIRIEALLTTPPVFLKIPFFIPDMAADIKGWKCRIRYEASY